MKIKSEILVSCWLFKITCTPCYVSSDEEEILRAVGKIGQDIMWQIKWLHLSMRCLSTPTYMLGIEAARYTKINIRYIVLISRQLQYFTTLSSRINQLFQCVLLIFCYAYALALNIHVSWKLVNWFKAERGEWCDVFYTWHS